MKGVGECGKNTLVGDKVNVHEAKKTPAVLVVNSGYAQQRNMIYAKSFGVDCSVTRDRLSILHKVWHRLSGEGYSSFLHCWALVTCPKDKLVHSFNGIVFGCQYWVVTFETNLPRLGSIPSFLVRITWRKLADSNCVAILALSDSARQILKQDLFENRPKMPEVLCSAIRKKLFVLHPPQPLFVHAIEEKQGQMDWNGPLRLALIGHDFYRKGGLEALMAVEVLLEAGKDIHLSIAGKMVAHDYASRAGKPEIRKAEAIMEKFPDQIQCLGSLPGEAVKDLLVRSHILCLPTWGDTYGYSVLEGQAAGCAAITTNIRALPEINNNDCGWVISVPKLYNGDGDLDTSEKREHFRDVLVNGLVTSIKEAHDDRFQLERKARASLERIRREHDPEKHADRLKAIYSRTNANG